MKRAVRGVVAAVLLAVGCALAVPATADESMPEPAPFRVVGLGDSVPAAWTLELDDSYVTLVGRAQADEAGRPSDVYNLAFGGATSDDVVAQLADPWTSDAVARGDLVIVTVGANDLDPDELGNAEAEDAALERTGQKVRQLVGEVRRLAPTARVVLTGYWNVFEGGAVAASEGEAYMRASDDLTRRFNALVGDVAASEHVVYADIYTPFKALGDDTPLLAADGDHPSRAGHAVIAEAIERALA